MLSNSISMGNSAYVADYIVTNDRAIGNVSLFGKSLKRFNVKIRKNKFIVHDISSGIPGVKTHLTFNVDGKFRGNETLMEKAVEHITEISNIYELSAEDIARMAIMFYVERMN